MHGKRVEPSFERKRLRCTACGKMLLNSLRSMDHKRQMTSRPERPPRPRLGLGWAASTR